MMTSLIASYTVLVVMMGILWLIFRRFNNAAIVDVGWGFGFVIVGIVYFLTADGLLERKILITAMTIIWGGRLAWHLLTDRILSEKPEDGRYQNFRKKWKSGIKRKFFYFFQFQALLIVIFSTPLLITAENQYPEITTFEWLGIIVWIIGVAGESVADIQLKKFKDDPLNKGKTFQKGLWKYSRHPNYFFEWVIWIAYAIIAFNAPYGWLAIASPLGMLYILLKVTGVSLTEEHALRSRGEEYRDYQRMTSAFIPLPRKNERKEMKSL